MQYVICLSFVFVFLWGEGKIDSIEVDDVFINNQVKLQFDTDKFMTVFGNPDLTKKKINEYHGFQYEELFYKNSSFVFNNDKLAGFNLVDDSFYLTYKGCRIEVGSDENILKNLFNFSYREKYTVEDDSYIVKIQFEDYDEYLMFKIKERKVISIFTWVDW
jgi:hypothetical protein